MLSKPCMIPRLERYSFQLFFYLTFKFIWSTCCSRTWGTIANLFPPPTQVKSVSKMYLAFEKKNKVYLAFLFHFILGKAPVLKPPQWRSLSNKHPPEIFHCPAACYGGKQLSLLTSSPRTPQVSTSLSPCCPQQHEGLSTLEKAIPFPPPIIFSFLWVSA